MKGMYLGLLISHEDAEQDALLHEVFDVAVVVEGNHCASQHQRCAKQLCHAYGHRLLCESWVSREHEAFLWVSPESGDEDQPWSNLCMSTGVEKQNNEAQSLKSVFLFCYIKEFLSRIHCSIYTFKPFVSILSKDVTITWVTMVNFQFLRLTSHCVPEYRRWWSKQIKYNLHKESIMYNSFIEIGVSY